MRNLRHIGILLGLGSMTVLACVGDDPSPNATPNNDGGAGGDGATDDGGDGSASDADAAAQEPVEVGAGGGNTLLSGVPSGDQTCVRMSGGSVLCFGGHQFGQLGREPAPRDFLGPGLVELPPSVQAARLLVSTSQQTAAGFGCVVDATSRLLCWGSNGSYELGRGTFDSVPHPQPVVVTTATAVAVSGITDVALGGHFGCLIAPDGVTAGVLQCWGKDTDCIVSGVDNGNCASQARGQPGAVANVPKSVLVAAGAATACAVSDTRTTATCWGNDKYKTLGRVIATGIQPAPVEFASTPTKIARLAMGNGYACVVDEVSAGHTKVICWGQNSYGQLGTTVGNYPTPIELADFADFTDLAAGPHTLCAFKKGDPSAGVFCMGNNWDGQLGKGDKDTLNHSVPSRVGDLVDVLSVAVGGAHVCAVARKTGSVGPRKLYCWGKNDKGEVTGTSNDPAPQVTSPTEVVLP